MISWTVANVSVDDINTRSPFLNLCDVLGIVFDVLVMITIVPVLIVSGDSNRGIYFDTQVDTRANELPLSVK